MDPETDPLAAYRANAAPQLAGNILTLRQLAREGYAPSATALPRSLPFEPSPAYSEADEAGQRAATAALAGIERGVEAAGRQMAETGGSSTWPRAMGAGAIKAPAAIYDLAHVASARDPKRAAVGVAGSRIGAIVGGSIIPEIPPLDILATAGGAYLGDAGFTHLYDHPADIPRTINRLAGKAEDAFRRGMPPYGGPTP